jgi:hypothetical protein
VKLDRHEAYSVRTCLGATHTRPFFAVQTSSTALR